MSVRVLVTGVTGQTGSYLAETLLRHGHEVVGVSKTTENVVDGVDLRQLDLTDTDALGRLVDEVRPDAIVNLAAQSSVARAWQDPVGTAVADAIVPAAVFAAARRLADDGIDCQVVQASSSEVFGAPASGVVDESTPVAPTNPYGAAKAHAHHLVAAYRAAGLRASSLILFNHESPRRPKRFVTRLITSAVADVARGRADEVVLADPSIERDWGWAPDVAEAIRLVVEARASRDYVVATGVAHSVGSFALAALAAAGVSDPESRIRVDPSLARPTDVKTVVGDSSRLREELGWQPTVGFEDIVRAMVDADLAATPED
ncbi:GDP-mannose 4,6-dehydratase [Curtobacterium pusillum]|uniref:GDP-mannose 4,6-dehydratase n=1 Tax=Curtobacterium pusillum TaxID=69373 RepID=UPI001C930B75|nr:GDP-mannose 4,6-dehydratase [Curtobacterium pusillum]